MSNFTMSGLSIVIVLAAAVIVVANTLAHDSAPNPPSDGDKLVSTPTDKIERTALPDVKMPRMNKDSRSSLICCLRAMLPVLGHSDWSIPRLEAQTGYAFHFEMREAGESVFDDNLDWGLAMHVLKPLGQAKIYDATKGSDVDLPALKAKARDAVVANLEKGIPGLVWPELQEKVQAWERFPASTTRARGERGRPAAL